jgi:hypothetical protein
LHLPNHDTSSIESWTEEVARRPSPLPSPPRLPRYVSSLYSLESWPISLPTVAAFLNWFLGARDFPACQIKPYMAPCGPLISGSLFLCASNFSVNRTVLWRSD